MRLLKKLVQLFKDTLDSTIDEETIAIQKLEKQSNRDKGLWIKK